MYSSDNQIGNNGARILAKALQVNAKLETILLDINGVTHVGYQDLCWAMVRLSENEEFSVWMRCLCCA